MMDRLASGRDSAAFLRDLQKLRRDLYAMPEVGLHLPRTQRLVLAELQRMGIEFTVGVGLSSVIGVIRGSKAGATVLLRADMDALPIADHSGLEFAAQLDPSLPPAMHACGHDLHMASLLGAAELLIENQDRLSGDVILMFQPGEEGHHGAALMLDEGLFDSARSEVVAAYGLHVYTGWGRLGQISSRPGVLTAASAAFTVHVSGTGGHASMPHRSTNSLLAATAMIQAIQAGHAARIDPFDPVIVTVTAMNSGNSHNIIPPIATFQGTIRAFSQEAMEQVFESIRTACRSIAESHAVTAEVEIEHQYPAVINDAGEFAFTQGCVDGIFGPERFSEEIHPSTGSEDFAYILGQVPGTFLMVCASPEGASDANHSSSAVFDDSVLADTALLLASLAFERLRNPALA